MNQETTGGGVYSAGEAVGPNAMSPEEWSAQPGAQGGQAPVIGGGAWDWRKALGAAGGAVGNGSFRPSPLMSSGGMGGGQTQSDPITFRTILELLQILQGAGAKKGAR